MVNLGTGNVHENVLPTLAFISLGPGRDRQLGWKPPIGLDVVVHLRCSDWKHPGAGPYDAQEQASVRRHGVSLFENSVGIGRLTRVWFVVVGSSRCCVCESLAAAAEAFCPFPPYRAHYRSISQNFFCASESCHGVRFAPVHGHRCAIRFFAARGETFFGPHTGPRKVFELCS
uniref:Uncharacterized protein n=1 Tax=Anopheles melas TaxID=34690 RepID=A0A182TK56_9DIPT